MSNPPIFKASCSPLLFSQWIQCITATKPKNMVILHTSRMRGVVWYITWPYLNKKKFMLNQNFGFCSKQKRYTYLFVTFAAISSSGTGVGNLKFFCSPCFSSCCWILPVSIWDSWTSFSTSMFYKNASSSSSTISQGCNIPWVKSGTYEWLSFWLVKSRNSTGIPWA